MPCQSEVPNRGSLNINVNSHDVVVGRIVNVVIRRSDIPLVRLILSVGGYRIPRGYTNVLNHPSLFHELYRCTSTHRMKCFRPNTNQLKSFKRHNQTYLCNLLCLGSRSVANS